MLIVTYQLKDGEKTICRLPNSAIPAVDECVLLTDIFTGEEMHCVVSRRSFKINHVRSKGRVDQADCEVLVELNVWKTVP